MPVPVVTIDGPSGAGKGTVSRAVAKQMGWNYLDSGSIYRSLAIAVTDKKIPFDNEDAIVQVAQEMKLEFECGSELIVKLDGVNISDRLPTEVTGNAASKVAAMTGVRRVLLQKQRDFQQAPGLVADGRDMGTVVFPDAEYKVFLTASAAERATRRYKQLMEKGIHASIEILSKEIEKRDRRDMERENAPLAMADDALYLDSSNMPVDQVVEEVLSLIR